MSRLQARLYDRPYRTVVVELEGVQLPRERPPLPVRVERPLKPVP